MLHFFTTDCCICLQRYYIFVATNQSSMKHIRIAFHLFMSALSVIFTVLAFNQYIVQVSDSDLRTLFPSSTEISIIALLYMTALGMISAGINIARLIQLSK